MSWMLVGTVRSKTSNLVRLADALLRPGRSARLYDGIGQQDAHARSTLRRLCRAHGKSGRPES